MNTPSASSPSSNEFTPINSPKGMAIDAAMKHENEDTDASFMASIKTEDMNETQTDVTAPTTTTETPTNTPAKETPRKRGRKANTTTPSKKPKASTSKGQDADNNNTTTTNDTASPAGTPGRAALPPIATSIANASDEDKMILRLRDEENKPWPEITKTFQAETGIKVGGSTLRMRYNTMKANFVSACDEDAARLLRIKKEVEEKFEAEKWHRIADAIVADGGAKYPNTALAKKFKEISKGGGGGTAAVTGSKDEETDE
ncbi:hypothetical protein BJX61DRAFT_542518 [Aspergillus egyptiacus]|nr:hypothetical protein BJX61DRAFT_542518 [Aspergillus egyptiacus]